MSGINKESNEEVKGIKIFNISSHVLTENGKKVLEKGLKYAPAIPINKFETFVNIHKFIRKLCIKKLFLSKESVEELGNIEMTDHTPFKPKSVFYPAHVKGNFIDTFCQLVQEDVREFRPTGIKHNFTSKERAALKDLKQNTEIVIKHYKMSSKRSSSSEDKGEEVAKKKTYKSGSVKRSQALQKSLREAGNAPGQQKLWQLKDITVESVDLTVQDVPKETLQQEAAASVASADEGLSTVIISEPEYSGENIGGASVTETHGEDTGSSTESDISFSPLPSSAEKCNVFHAPEALCSVSVKLHFMKAHPVQPSSDATHTLPFHAHKVYYRHVPGGSAIQRKWLSYCVDSQKIFCSTCMAFCSIRKSNFIFGWKVNKDHVNSRVREHEESNQHQAAVNAYLSAERKSDIETLINVNLANKKRDIVQHNRMVISRLIAIILYIAKQCLAYRGKDEAAHTLLNSQVNHGNFLELVLLLGKFDEVLEKQIEQAVAKSKARKRRQQESKGRGGLVTFLSKTTVNKLIIIIIIIIMGNMIKQKISQYVKDAVKFSVEMDSTQDIGVVEQCSIILRYTKDGMVSERLFGLVDVKSTTGEALFSVLKERLEMFSLPISNIIGCSFDGAANMSGCYNGLQAHIKSESCKAVYTWCYAHILNLVIVDITQCVTPVKSLFGLLEKTACFFSESYKRLSVWKEQVSKQRHGQEKLSRLKKIGDTRWWSKPRALSTIFGSASDQSNELYSTRLYCLEYISLSPEYESKIISKAEYLLHGWTRHETLLVSFMFMQIFEIVTPVSDYLQTAGLDILQAWRMVGTAKSLLQKLRTSFSKLIVLVNAFTEKVDSSLDGLSVSAEVQKSLPGKRITRKKMMPGELSQDEPIEDPLKGFEIQTFYVVLDQAVQSIDRRVSKNESLIRDLTYFEPRQFAHMKQGQSEIPIEALRTVADLAEVDIVQLKVELVNFVQNYSVLKNPDSPQITSVTEEELDVEDTMSLNMKNKACENCLTCCYRLLYHHNLHSAAYMNLFVVYKTLHTLACTQVSCERVFSKLKIVKTRLRSMIGQELLESFLLLNTERDIAGSFVFDEIIDTFAHSSSLLERLLL
ncbi:zinc finger MYM-type protein 1-like [Pseudophryne corroboree]|uniref:zinc finger MYM-type protein 1-like n=1 Tax=Pseudophryne corroboree TaxID=495146 RepID=UPI0030818D17